MMSDCLNWGKSYHRDNAKTRTLDLTRKVFGEEKLAGEFDLTSNKEDMNEEKLYNVVAIYTDANDSFEYEVKIRTGYNIIGKAEEKGEMISGKRSFKIYEIFEIPKCDGCQIEACGQRDHMIHPDGCLHDPSDCDLCQMELKNILKLSDQITKTNG